MFADAADKIAEKYKHDPVAEKMILAVAEELETCGLQRNRQDR